MKTLLLIALLAIFNAGCSKTSQDKVSLWKVTAVAPETGFCTTGMNVVLEKDLLKMVSCTTTAEFPVILSEYRLVADTGLAKILFSVVKPSDSTMVWEELYASTPLVVHLTKIKTH